MPYWVYWVSGSSQNASPVVSTAPLGEQPAWRWHTELVGTFANQDLARQLACDMARFQIAMLRVKDGWAKFWSVSPAERARMVETVVEEENRFRDSPRMTLRRRVF